MEPYIETDEYSVAIMSTNTAMWVHKKIKAGESVAIPLDLANMTMFHMSFVPLWKAVPSEVFYADGSSMGIQINIDRHASYALPSGSKIDEWSYLAEKLQLGRADAEALLPFINTVLTGKDCFEH